LPSSDERAICIGGRNAVRIICAGDDCRPEVCDKRERPSSEPPNLVGEVDSVRLAPAALL
jgi:hypothetical protein